MAAACSTSLATQTTVATTQSFSTLTSTVVSTLSPGVTTITSTHPCSGGGGSGTSASAACSPVVTTVTSTVPGGTTTLTTLGTSTIDVLTTQTTTFLNSSCSTFTASAPLPSEPSTTTSVLIVTNNGQVSTQYIVSTVLPESLQTNRPVKTTSGAGGKNVGGIVGGVFGGLAGVMLLVLGGLWFMRRRKRWDVIFDKDDNNAWTPGPGVNSDPYAYGPVGGRRDRLEMDDSGQGRRMVLD